MAADLWSRLAILLLCCTGTLGAGGQVVGCYFHISKNVVAVANRPMKWQRATFDLAIIVKIDFTWVLVIGNTHFKPDTVTFFRVEVKTSLNSGCRANKNIGKFFLVTP